MSRDNGQKPVEFIAKCRNCKREPETYFAPHLCATCYRYQWRTGKPRPMSLYAPAEYYPVCQECQRLIKGKYYYNVRRCRTCYMRWWRACKREAQT